MTTLRVDMRTVGGVLVLALHGDLDLAGAVGLEEAIARAALDGDGTVVVDLRGVDFMDSSGLRVLITAAQRAEKDSGRFALVPGQAQVMRVFEITRMNEWLRFVEDPSSVERE